MKIVNKKLFVSLIFLIFMCSSLPAHTLWINLTDHNPSYHDKFGGFTKAYFGWGHKYPVSDFIKFENIIDFNLVNTDGERENLTPNPGGFLATQIKLKEQGTYWVEAVKKPGFYTMYEEKGKIRHKSSTMEGVENVVLSLYYHEFSKALINTGIENKNALLRPLGHLIEIIPLENPSNLKKDEILPVQVLFKGKPGRYIQVFGTYTGFSNKDDYAYATTTNKDGIAKIRLLERGHWLLKVKKKLNPTKDLKDKCLNLSYKASMTFEVK